MNEQYPVVRRRRLRKYFACVAAVYLALAGLYGLTSAWAASACRLYAGPSGPAIVTVDGGIFYDSKMAPLAASDTITLLVYAGVPFVQAETGGNSPAWLSYGVSTRYVSYELSSTDDPDCERFLVWRSRDEGRGVLSSHRASAAQRDFVDSGLPHDACIARRPLSQPDARYSVHTQLRWEGIVEWDVLQLTDLQRDEVIAEHRQFNYCMAGRKSLRPPRCWFGDLFARTCRSPGTVAGTVGYYSAPASALLGRLKPATSE